MKKIFVSILVSFSFLAISYAANNPCTPQQGCTGINNSNTITVGGNLLTTGALNINSPFSAGSVLFSDGSSSISQNNSKFFWNNTLFRLGVGDSNLQPPGSTLQVSDNTGTSGINDGLTVMQFGSGDALLHFGLNSGQVWTTGVDSSDGGSYKISNDYGLGSSDALSIDVNKKVSINGLRLIGTANALQLNNLTSSQMLALPHDIGSFIFNTSLGEPALYAGAGGWLTLAYDVNVMHVTGSETINGTKTFTSTINGSVNGNAATVTTNANLNGDVTSAGNTTTLATVNSSPATYGDGTHVAQVTVNGKGLVTAASNVLITGAAPTGSASGDLSGTYPNPTVLKTNGVSFASSATTDTTNAANISSGVLAGARLSGAYTGITVAESQVTNLTTDLASKLSLSGGTMSGSLVLNADPTASLQAATKNYVDTVAAGLQTKEATQASSTANLTGTYVNGVSGVGATFTLTATGALVLDGQTVSSGRILLKNQTSGFQNGVYDITTPGSVGVSAILTRSANYNTASDINAGDLIPVINGTTLGGTTWLQTATVNTIGTDALVFSQFGGGATVLVGDVTGSGFSPTSTTVTKINGNALASTTPTNGNALLGNGSQWASSPITASIISGILAGDNGGTNNGFMQFSGPASSLKTYTLPNVSTTILTTSAAVTPGQGGIGQDSSGWLLGDMPYLSTTGGWNHLAGNTTGTRKFMRQTGTGTVSAAPAWDTLLAADVPGSALTKTDDTNVTLTLGGSASTALLNPASITAGWLGQLGLARGGSNANLTANNGGIVWSNASALQILAGTATAGQMLQSGATASPSWSTSKFASTYSANNLLYAFGSNDVQGLPTALNGVLATNGAGVPSIASTLPSAVQSNITGLGTVTSGTVNGSVVNYNTTNLKVTANQLNTIQDIGTSSTPQFTGVNVSGLGATGVVTTDGSSNLSSVNSVTTFTPFISDGSGNNFTTSTATGQYYKVGHIYYVTIYAVWTSKGSAIGSNGLVINLPASIGANCARATGSVGYQSGISFSGTQLIYTASAGAGGISFYGISNIGVATQVTTSQAASSGQIQVNLTYWDN